MKYTLMIIFITLNSIVSATTYYVSKNGSNSNPGTLTSPFLTINYGHSRLSGGDTLYVRAGTYNERLTFYNNSGTAGENTAIMAYNNEKVIMDGTGIDNGSGGALVMIYSNYALFYGIDIQNVNMTGSLTGGWAIKVTSTGSKISHCNIHNVWEGGIATSGKYCTIEYCNVYDACMSNSDGVFQSNENWAAGIIAARYPDHCIIRHCYVYNVWGEGISTYEATNTTIEDNVVCNAYSVHIYVSDATDCLIQRNLVYMTRTMGDGAAVGIGLWNEKYSPTNARNVFINNIAYGCQKNFKTSTGASDIVIANNAFVNSSSTCDVQFSGVLTSSIFENNIIVQEDGLSCMYYGSESGVHFSNNLYNKSYDTDAAGSGDIVGDPNFTKTGEISIGKLTPEYFKLLSTSPAINNGVVVSKVTEDIFGTPRGTSPDIGVYEYSGTTTTVKVSGIAVTGAGGASTISTNKGTLQLSAAVTPANATNKAVTWSISNGTGQATINTSGLVTAITNGTVTAKATANDGSGVNGTLSLTITSQIVPVTGIIVTGTGGATTITTDKGSLQLSADITPANATSKAVTWSISNGTGQATISTSGLVTAIASGTVTAKATANDGSGVYGTLSLTIASQNVPVTGITVTGTGGANTINTDKGSLQLSAAITPANATSKAVTWSISNGTGQATINTSGLVTAIASGTVTAKATANDGSGVYGTLSVTIASQNVPVTGITVTGTGSANTITTDNGTLQLSAAVTPANATNKAVTWSISNGTGEASINTSGLVTAIVNGTVIAKATAKDGSDVYGTLQITISNQVMPAIPSYLNSAVENATPTLLEITYNSTLANILPAVAAFSVKVNSATRSVNSVAISGTKVILTLASPIIYGDAVTVAYVKPDINPLQTASGGLAVSLSAQVVTNKVAALNTAPNIVVNYKTSDYSGFVGKIDASGSYDSNKDNLTFSWTPPANIPVSSTSGSTIQYLGPIVSSSQKVEFTLKISDGKTSVSKVIPIEILPYKPELEVAEIGNVEASSFQSPNYPYNIIDGNIGTMWAAEGENQWLIIELKQSFDIQHIKLSFQPGQSKEFFFDVMGSEDKVNWEPILTKSSSCDFSNDLQVFEFPLSKTGKEYKYIKLIGFGNITDKWNYISELKIYGYRNRKSPDYEKLAVKIYPNPAHEYVTVRIDESTMKPDFIKLLDLSGKVMYKAEVDPDINEFTIPLDLKRGIYIVELDSNKHTIFTQKLVIS